ncbi:MAG: ketol-acid reductoisomerase, partial [Candidatus Krumholzibacteria bacterium]|nr:ketol-acid reductoisomerase [Candidatus Krumholzibacteria bacterium]
AAWGSMVAGERIVDARVRDAIEGVLDDVESGAFASEWMAEAEKGQPRLDAGIREESQHPLELAGRRVRALMPYLSGSKSS